LDLPLFGLVLLVDLDLPLFGLVLLVDLDLPLFGLVLDSAVFSGIVGHLALGWTRTLKSC
jgi:hypothetical protein